MSSKRIVLAVCTVLLLTAFPARAQQFGPWSAPVNLGAAVNSMCSDQHPALSKDGLSLYFASDRILDENNNVVSCAGAPNHLQLWVARRDCLDSADPACNWQRPEFLKINSAPDPHVPSPFVDVAPNLSTDGHWLFFHSRRPGGCNTGHTANGYFFELWAARRQNNRDDQGWETPINLGCTLNIPETNEAGPSFWEDDSTSPPTLYLYINRDLLPNNLQALGHCDPNAIHSGSPDSDVNGSCTDIYVSTCTADLDTCNRQPAWSPAIYVPELSSSVRDTRTAIRRRDGLEMILTSSRCNSPIPPADLPLCSTLSTGGFDSWVSTRASAQDAWSIPIDINQDNLNKCNQLGIDLCPVVPVVDSSANDGAPALSWDGQTLIFYSNRPGGSGGNDLYVSTRTKLCDSTTNTSCVASLSQ